MNKETWALIDRQYQRFPSDHANGIEPSEFDASFAKFQTTSDYRDFVLRYGGGLVGTYPIYGLRLAEDMGMIEKKATAPEITEVFRKRKWPAVEGWLVFSVDQSGNPIGLLPDGSVSISDGARAQVQRLSSTFEGFLLKWCLKVGDSLTPKD